MLCSSNKAVIVFTRLTSNKSLQNLQTHLHCQRAARSGLLFGDSQSRLGFGTAGEVATRTAAITLLGSKFGTVETVVMSPPSIPPGLLSLNEGAGEDLRSVGVWFTGTDTLDTLAGTCRRTLPFRFGSKDPIVISSAKTCVAGSVSPASSGLSATPRRVSICASRPRVPLPLPSIPATQAYCRVRRFGLEQQTCASRQGGFCAAKDLMRRDVSRTARDRRRNRTKQKTTPLQSIVRT